MASAILFFGGNSDERLVSVASAQNLANRFPFDEHWYLHTTGEVSRVTKEELLAHERPFEIEFSPRGAPLSRTLADALPQIRGRVMFMAMHGTQGEDGQIQRLFEEHRICYTGSNAQSSADCFDKMKSKVIARRHGLPLADERVLRSSEKSLWKTQVLEFAQKNPRFVLKPIASGSSVGLQIVKDPAQTMAAVESILQNNLGDYMIEAFLEGRELTVGVLQRGQDLVALPASEVVLNEGYSFDYQGKYLGRGTTEITPAQLTSSELESAQALALKAHRDLGCGGYSRTDMILTKNGPVFLETNTLPGLSKASFIPQQLAAAQIPLADFLREQIEWGARRYD